MRIHNLKIIIIPVRFVAKDQDPDEPELDVEHEFFDNEMWPYLAERIPAFNAIKV